MLITEKITKQILYLVVVLGFLQSKFLVMLQSNTFNCLNISLRFHSVIDAAQWAEVFSQTRSKDTSERSVYVTNRTAAPFKSNHYIW